MSPIDSPSRRRLLQMVLATGMAPAFVHHALAVDENRFSLGVASGHPRPDGMVLWTRVTGTQLPAQVAVRWEIARDEHFKDIAAHGTETAEDVWSHSVHAEPVGLDPGRWYWYRFLAMGHQSMVGRTRTAPAPADDVRAFNFAIASCQRWDNGFYAAWKHMANEELDLVMFLGDYIYESGSDPGRVRLHEGGRVHTLEGYRARYAQYKSDPMLQAAHAAFPWLYVWDDHEVSNDYAADRDRTLSGRAFLAQRAAAYQAYWEHQPFPKALRPRGPDMRIYGHHHWGRLARVMTLDNRQYRDPQACLPRGRLAGGTIPLVKDCPGLALPQRTLLGTEQERWLADSWDVNRPWNLLAQQTLMARFSARDPRDPESPGGQVWTDGWEGYPQARRRLLETLVQKKVTGAVVLGGDVHTNYVTDLKLDFDDFRAPTVATEFCGTSISSNGIAHSRLSLVAPFNPHVRYCQGDQRGYMRFSVDTRQMRMHIRTLDNVLDPASGIKTTASFVVEASRPGAERV